jgi:hypothetical protein
MGRSTQAGTRAASSKKASPKKASLKKASPKASPKKASPKKASPKKASPKKASPKASATPIAQRVARADALPAWATKAPDAAGLLPVPDAKRKALAAALGPLDRQYGIVRKVGMVAVAGPTRIWGLHRQLSVSDGEGSALARVLEVLAREALPLTGLELWYPEAMVGGTPAALASILEQVLSTKAAQHLERFTLVSTVAIEGPASATLASRLGALSGLRALDLRGRGGTVVEPIRAFPPLTSLALVSVGVGAVELAELARSPGLGGLQSLVLEHVESDAASMRLLVARHARLERVELSPKLLLPSDWTSVASLEVLRELRLRFPNDETMKAIAQAAFLPRLTRLELRDATIDLATAKRLAAHGLPVLERLDLKSCEISEAALRILVDAAPALTTLGIPSSTRPQTWARRGRTVL